MPIRATDDAVGDGVTLPSVTGARRAVTYGATMNLDGNLANMFLITPTDGVAFTVNATNFPAGRQITLTVKNTFGVLGALTFGAAFKAVAWTQPANGFSRTVQFISDGANLIEAFRSAADVAN